MKTVLALLLAAVAALAQSEAALSGVVSDSSGAVLQNATVKLTNRAQGTAQTGQTNNSGAYRFPFVQPGIYDIEISSAGFKTLTSTSLTLGVAENLRRDFRLEVGNVAENVTVVAGAETINTESAELGSVVDNTRVVEMPLNGRTFFSLATITPGVVPAVQGSNLGFRGGFNVSGNPETANNFTLNGFDNNDASINVPNFRPSIDAIQEFNILTGVYSAQYGYASGGQVIVTTKAGGNQFHGASYEFLRNQAIMAARNFFAQPGPLPPFKRNQFGTVLGGPVQKDKTFFFLSYEGLRQRSGFFAVNTVPTPAMLGGDFSSIATRQVVRDPTTGAGFANNVVPPSRLSPVGRALAGYYPVPTAPTAFGALPANNFVFTPVRPESFNLASLRMDHTFSPRDSAYLSANWYDNHSTETLGSNCGNPAIPGFTCAHQEKSEMFGIAETHVFSPSLVNEARVAFTLTYAPNIYNIGNVPFWSQFGIRSAISSVPGIGTGGTPATTITGYANIPGPSTFIRHDPHWQWSDIASFTRGRHNVKIGGILSHYATNERNNFSVAGGLAFNNSSQGPTSGYGLADVLLGLPASSSNAPYSYPVYLRSSNIGAFLMDDYKVNSRLTLNIGLRWELNTPFVDRSRHYSNFDAKTGLVQVQENGAAIPAGVTAGISPIRLGDHAVSFDWKDYAPRVGFAWQPFGDGKTVIRGGAGTFFQNLSTLNALIGYSMASTYPYIPTLTYTSSVAQPVTLANPFPTTNAVTSSNLNAAQPQYINARVYQWSFGVQRQLTGNTLLELTYFGSSGNHFQVARNINQPAPGAGTPAQVQARRPYPAWGTINQAQFNANSHFESLQTKLQKRFGAGLSFIVSYTWGKSIDDFNLATNAFDRQSARGLSTFDVRHRLVMTPVYELPFGKGKRWLTDGVVGKIAGGWQISALSQWQTGAPLTATLSGNFSNTGGTTDRPNVIGNPNDNAPHTPQKWFNTAAFQVPAASGAAGALYSFGNEGRGVILGPGLVATDFSLVRNFQAREWLKIQARAEWFNAFNHANFQFPGLVANTTTFGSISGALDPRVSQVSLKLVY